MHYAFASVLLGSGESLLDGLNLLEIGYRCREHVTTPNAMHVVVAKLRSATWLPSMNEPLAAFLQALYDNGVSHDAAQPDRLLKHRNLEPPTAEELCAVLTIARARQVVEIGRANAYSTIWLADALADTSGHLVSVDVAISDSARANLARADAIEPGLATRVELRQDDGGAYLAQLADASVDLLFLDAERVEYPLWWPHPMRVLRPGGVLAIDNVLSHPDEVAPFLALLSGESSLTGTTINVGKGLHLAWRRAEIPGAD